MADNCCNNEKDACCGSPPPLELPTKKAAGGDCARDVCGCSGGVPVFDGMDPRYKLMLWTVIGINGAMFLTEMTAGQLAGSQALQADALDFLGDTITYGLSLAVIGASLRTSDGVSAVSAKTTGEVDPSQHLRKVKFSPALVLSTPARRCERPTTRQLRLPEKPPSS